MFFNLTIPAESCANNLEPCPKKFIVLFKEGFLIGWVSEMVLLVVVMFLRLLVKKATTKMMKKIMKEAIGGNRGSFTNGKKQEHDDGNLFELFCLYFQVSVIGNMISKDYFK